MWVTELPPVAHRRSQPRCKRTPIRGRRCATPRAGDCRKVAHPPPAVSAFPPQSVVLPPGRKPGGPFPTPRSRRAAAALSRWCALLLDDVCPRLAWIGWRPIRGIGVPCAFQRSSSACACAAGRASLLWHEARHSSPIGMACIAMVPSSLVADAQCLEAQLLSLLDTHLLALHQRRKMRAILSLGGCSRTAPCWADTAVQLVRPQIGGRQWSWQLRWRAFEFAEQCRSSQQHRSSHGAALDVFVCLRVLVDVVVVVEFGVRLRALGHRSRYGVDASFYTQDIINVN